MFGMRSIAVAAAATAMFGAAPVANATADESGGVSCRGGMAAVSLRPGLALEARDVSGTSALNAPSCVQSGGAADVSSASASLRFNGRGACVVPLGIPSATASAAITWGGKNGDASSATTGTLSLTIVGMQYSGTVTSGLYQGSRVSATATWPEDALNEGSDCLSGAPSNDIRGTMDALFVGEI